jgi:hypothetical protein
VPTTSKSRSFARTFCVRPANLEAAWNIVSEAGKDAGVKFWCSDGSIITSDGLETLLEFQNAKFRRIIRVDIENAYRSETRVAASFKGSFDLGPEVGYQIDGEDRNVIYLSNKIEEIFSGIWPWYSRITLFPKFLLSAVTALIFYIVSIAIFTMYYGKFSQIPNGILLLLGFPLLAIATLSGVSAFYSIDYMFPRAIFEIGAGTRRSASATFARRTVGGTLGLGIVASLVAGLLLR